MFPPRQILLCALCVCAVDPGRCWSRCDTARCESYNRTGRNAGCGTPGETLPDIHPGHPPATGGGSSPAEAHFGRTYAPIARTLPGRHAERPESVNQLVDSIGPLLLQLHFGPYPLFQRLSLTSTPNPSTCEFGRACCQ